MFFLLQKCSKKKKKLKKKKNTAVPVKLVVIIIFVIVMIIMIIVTIIIYLFTCWLWAKASHVESLLAPGRAGYITTEYRWIFHTFAFH